MYLDLKPSISTLRKLVHNFKTTTMKKIMIFVGALTLSGTMFAQKATKENPFSLEGQLSYNTSSLSFNAPSLRMRYFLADDLAARVSLSINNSSSKDYYYELADNAGGEGTEVNKISMTTISLGAEKHFKGTDKLSPYVGADLAYGMGNTSAKWDKFDGSDYNADVTATVKAPSSMIGLNLVAGTDYYFAQNFYVGLELGLGFSSTSNKAKETIVNVAGTSTTTLEAPSNSSSFGNNFIGNARLGWRF
jgi:outer membrane protein W